MNPEITPPRISTHLATGPGIVNDKKIEAQPKLKGFCPNCYSEIIAKCGGIKIWHWAHKGRPPCDPWWESETEWHRSWKNNFPVEWQEVGHIDPLTGEKHIADVKNPLGLVIELQHSPINPEERQAREKFYQKMIWIVDGARNDFDPAHFKIGLRGPIQNDPLAYQISWWGRSRLLQNWAHTNARVYLDFGSDVVWHLSFFDPKKKIGTVEPIPKESLIENCKTDNLPYKN